MKIFSTALSRRFFPHALKKWLMGVNRYSAARTPSDAVADRKCKFLKKFIMSDNTLCQVFKDVAMDELALLASNAY